MSESAQAFEGWVILELFGHRRLAGYVREQEIAGTAFIRLDVPGRDGQPIATQFYSAASLYCLTPTTEEIARAVALANRPTPIQRWELPPAPATSEVVQENEGNEEGWSADS